LTIRLAPMTLIPGERYTITYRDGREERTTLAHYRGVGTGDAIARAEESTLGVESEGPLWFEIDGMPGYLTLDEDDLLGYEVAEGYGG